MSFSKGRRWLAVVLLLVTAAWARQEPVVCGTTRQNWREALHLNRQAQRIRRQEALRRLGTGAVALREPPPAALRQAPGYPDLILMEDLGGIVARRNEFNLDGRTLTFQPVGAGYRYTLGSASYDEAAAASGVRLPLGDDDTRLVALPFDFRFFGQTYQSVFVNSDGNLTFTAGDVSSSERSLGRFVAGPPRIAGLFRDLDPTQSNQGVRVLATSDRLVVSWVQVPEYRDVGVGPLETFQIRLFADGRIEFAYNGINTSSAVVGIAPGRLQGASSVICFVCGEDADKPFTAAVAERFGTASELDIVTAAQQFFQAFDDAYDYLVIFNNLNVAAGESAIAYEVTVRNRATGIGDPPYDVGLEFGSKRRLKAIVNMGPLSQYPDDPAEPLRSRPASRESTLAILAHEVGHLFLAYASIRDPADPAARPLLGRQLAHWSFVFNSEASHLEGNRIRDDGPGVSPRFVTVGNAEQYAPLDQYLMGFVPPDQVPPVFLVTHADVAANRAPERGVRFNGERLEVRVEDIIAAEGPRRPDHTVAQRRFRAAFVLVIPKGAEPAAKDLEKLETLRQRFEAYYRDSAGGRAIMETAVRRALRVSAFPAVGVQTGASIPVTVAVEKPAEAPLTVSIRASGSGVAVPGSVTIPAGGAETRFQLTGVRAGVEEITFEPADSRYETVVARVQVASSIAGLRPEIVSGDKQLAIAGRPLPEPVVVRVNDANSVPYPGVRVQAAASRGGTVSPSEAVTDEEGLAKFFWTPGAEPLNELRLSVAGASVVATALGRPTISPGGVVNAASYRPELAPGALASVFGANLAAGAAFFTSFPWPSNVAGVQVKLNGVATPLLMVSDRQINFLIPLGAAVGDAEVVVSTPLGSSAAAGVTIQPTAPGIFFDAASGVGAVVVSGRSELTSERPAGPGDYLEIYATGLGAVDAAGGSLRRTLLAPRVLLGGREAEVSYSGLAPGYLGLYQVNARVPEGLPAGLQPLLLEIGGRRSNQVLVRLR